MPKVQRGSSSQDGAPGVLQADGVFRLGVLGRVGGVGLGALVDPGCQAAPSAWAEAPDWEGRGHVWEAAMSSTWLE